MVRKFSGIIVLILALKVAAFAQAPATCIVTGTVYDGTGQPKSAAVLTITPLGISGVLLHSASFTATSNSSGVVSFTVIRSAQYNIKGNVLSYTGSGLTVTIPNASASTLEALTSTSLVSATGLTIKSNGTSSFNRIGTLDFSSSFILTESPTGELNISISGGGGTWGSITGTLSNQTDLQSALDGKSSTSHNHSGAYEPANANIQSHISSTSNPHSVTKAQIGLGSVENTALSTWAGTTNITTLGTVSTGVWDGTAIAYSKLNLTGAVLNADLAGSIALSKLSITGTPDGTKFLRDDGSWQAVSASPGGSSGDIQYNNAGSFAGSLLKQGTNKIEQRNGTNSQTLSVFNAYVADDNYNKILVNAFSNGGALLFIGQGANRIDGANFYVGNSNPGGWFIQQAGGNNAFGYDPSTGNHVALGNSFVVDAGVKRVSTQFDKTSNTTLADIIGLSAPVFAGRTFNFRAVLYTTSNASGGIKTAIGGTATASAIIYEADVIEAGVLKVPGASRATSLGGTVANITAVTVAKIIIEGTITVNSSGTLTVQFAQNASDSNASSVLVGSYLKVSENP